MRRATYAAPKAVDSDGISIHALLAESDGMFTGASRISENFYPRSPCGERPLQRGSVPSLLCISIHALLAESDISSSALRSWLSYFYPRSPCGERLIRRAAMSTDANFYPRSPCGERPLICKFFICRCYHFYPRSPCGERHNTARRNMQACKFLSTLSLRRATVILDT